MSGAGNGKPARTNRDRPARIPSGEAIAFFVGVIIFLYLIRAILLPFVAAGILAFICTPLVDRLANTTHLPRWVCALGVLLALVAIVALVGLLGLPPLFRELSGVAGNLHGAIEGLMGKFIGDRTFHVFGMTLNASMAADYTVDAIRSWFGRDARLLTVTALGFAWTFGAILSLVLLGYFLIDARRISAGLFWLMPPRYRPFTRRTWHELGPALRRYFVGVALVVIYASAAAYVGLGLFLGLDHALVLALLTGILEIIPLVGPAASAIIAGLAAVQQAASTVGLVGYIIYAIALRISIDQFVGPIVLGRAGRIPPVLVIFCFLAGGLLFGIVGVVLAVPVALAVRIALHVLYDEPPPSARRIPPMEP